MRAVVFPVGSGIDNDLNFLPFPQKNAPGTRLAETSCRTIGRRTRFPDRTEKEERTSLRNRDRVLMGLVCIVLIAAFLGVRGYAQTGE